MFDLSLKKTLRKFTQISDFLLPLELLRKIAFS